MYPVATQLICSITSIVTIGYITLLRGNLGLVQRASLSEFFVTFESSLERRTDRKSVV